MHEQSTAFSSPLNISPIRRNLSTEQLKPHLISQSTCRFTCKYEVSSSRSNEPVKSFKTILAALTACIATTLSPVHPAKANQYHNSREETISDLLERSRNDTYSHSSTQSGHNYPRGSLLKVQPARPTIPYQNESTEGGNQPTNPSRPGSSTLSQSAASFSEWASSGVSRGLRARRPSRFPTWRPTTLGLVGVGAVTSGSVMLRTLSKKSDQDVIDDDENTTDLWSVINLHIPFCVSERALMLERMERLALTADVSSPGGMAKATREAAAVLLGEKGLLEDSRSFAPFCDVVVTESLAQAKKRFAAHVEIEGTRMGRAETDVCEQSGSDGDYGVLTMVVATTEGVNLHCYDDKCTVMKRLRCALDGIAMLQGGQVCGLELIWIPRSMTGTPLTRKQLNCEYPFLQIA